MTTTLEGILSQIAPVSGETFSPTRYPYTYACDFLRGNLNIVPAVVLRKYSETIRAVDEDVRERVAAGFLSRSDASQVLTIWADEEGRDGREFTEMMANAYLIAHRIVRPA